MDVMLSVVVGKRKLFRCVQRGVGGNWLVFMDRRRLAPCIRRASDDLTLFWDSCSMGSEVRESLRGKCNSLFNAEAREVVGGVILRLQPIRSSFVEPWVCRVYPCIPSAHRTMLTISQVFVLGVRYSTLIICTKTTEIRSLQEAT